VEGDTFRLPPSLENAIYRIAQEGLANACKHSQSERVRLSLVRQKGSFVRLEIRDLGVGFSPSQAEQGRFGLEGIQERTRLLGGQATIESFPGKGTRIIIYLPLAGMSEEDA